jgi:hypothetical protein
MRLAILLAAAAMTPGVGGIGGQLVRRGTKALGNADVLGKVSPGLGQIGGLVTGDLADAGKAAAMTAVNSRVEALSDRIHDQAESWRQAGPAGEDQEDQHDELKTGGRERPRGRSRRPEPDDAGQGDGRAAPRRRSSNTRRAPAGRADERGQTRSRPARSRNASGSAPPVRRSGRRSS